MRWYQYDTAVTHLIPARASLSRPKPDFAFGLLYETQSKLYDRLLDWKDKSSPSVDLFVAELLAVPFLVVESRSNMGTLGEAENQLANSMVKAHDILCSLDAQSDLFILGMVQVQYLCQFYISFSTKREKDRKSHVDTVSTLFCTLFLAY